MDIPKKIHQIWIGPKKMPTIWMDTFSVDYIGKFTDWEYTLWTDDNINELFINFPLIKIIYDLEPTYNGKSDLLRYLILYEHGGVYVDADMVWINNKNFDEALSQVNSTNFFLPYEPGDKNVCGAVMGCAKNNKYMKKIIEELEKLIIVDGNISKKKYTRNRNINGVCKVIGPIFLDKIYKTFEEQITIFPSVYFYPMSWHGVKSIDCHLSYDLPKESYTFQYGYTTNNFQNELK